MNTNFDDFLNPKSMPTPAAAGAIVAFIAGALFKNFGLSIAVGSALLSFLIGLIVLQSREFKGTSMSKLTKFVFYSINSLIIFAMATGTTTVMADEVLVQERPYFYDWTKKSGDYLNQYISGDVENYDFSVVVTPEKSSGIKKILERKGVLTKNYSTRVIVVPKGVAENQEIESVILRLPEKSFENPQVKLLGDQVDKGIKIKAWKSFPIEADVTTTTGESFRIQKYINPGLMMK